jgi:hypothetical protein
VFIDVFHGVLLFLFVLLFSRFSSLSREQRVIGNVIFLAPRHGQLNFDHRLVSFGGMERLGCTMREK